MTYYVLRSLSAPLLAIITDDPIVDNLPLDFAPWKLHERSVALVSPSSGPERIAAAIEENGYHIVPVAAARNRARWWRRRWSWKKVSGASP